MTDRGELDSWYAVRWQFKDTPDITQLPASTTCDEYD